jgi:histidinol-phosphate/aromatic aminotransferase/cobyric acid decarboxylase-like protein
MSTVWSAEQTYHGGQEHRDMQTFVEDFSVTCNALGTPEGALAAARESLGEIHHYPAADQQPALRDLAGFLFGATDSPLYRDASRRLILGNGASELIDLVTRLAPAGPFRGNPATATQYREYQRAATADGRAVVPHVHVRHDGGGDAAGGGGGGGDETFAALTAMVNPCNPTGDVLRRPELQRHIERVASDNSVVVVDESMLMWLGPEWRNDSLMTDPTWVRGLAETRGIKVYVMVSWTKIWACPGVRIGSLLCPDEDSLAAVKLKMVPWSVNTAALAFVSAVVRDVEYMERTWDITPRWRTALSDTLTGAIPALKVLGEPYLSWVWVDCGSEALAAAIVDECRAAGTPIRWGKYGYELPQFVRFGVRDPKFLPTITGALEKAKAKV